MKYRLAKWSILYTLKSVGGLRITNLDTQNVCLLRRWLFKLLNEDRIWHQLLRRKYLTNTTLAQVVKKPGDSHFLSGLMEAKEYFLPRGESRVNNGEQIRFWENWWLGNEPLMKQFPPLFNIARKKNQTMSSVLSTIPLNISFRRALVGDKLRMQLELVTLLVNVNMSDAEDKWDWKLGINLAFLSRGCTMI